MARSLGIAELLEAYRSSDLTPLDVVQDVLQRTAAFADRAVWIHKIPDADLMARSKSLMSDPLARQLPLYGIPFAIKDNIDAAGQPTTAGCAAFAAIAASDSTVVSRLLAAGAMLVGKTNLDQFATGLAGIRSPYGAPRCVFNASYISGGSSSGSAVAVAAGLVSFALGTDTAGSGRIPAGFNNIVGLKPTRGVISTTGVLPACRSLDCVSILALTAADAIAVLGEAQAEDPADPYSRAAQPAALPQAAFRFGILHPSDREFGGDREAEALYEVAIQNLASLGGTAVTIDYTPFHEVGALLYEGPFVAERLAAIAPFLASHADTMDTTVRSIIAGASRYSAADTFNGQYRLRALARQAAAEWRTIDVLLLPTAPTIFTVAAVQAEPLRLNSLLGKYTNFVNLLDYAAIAVPAGFRTDGIPLGVTLVGGANTDLDLARLGAQLHEAAGCGAGLDRALTLAPAPDRTPDGVVLAVAGAHLSGMPLNHELTELGAIFIEATWSSPDYRLLALQTLPPKPGLVRTPGLQAAGIALELWRLSEQAFGRFVAALPQPMGIGKVVLADGRIVSGFLCESYVTEGARDITAYGGWRKYVSAALP